MRSTPTNRPGDGSVEFQARHSCYAAIHINDGEQRADNSALRRCRWLGSFLPQLHLPRDRKELLRALIEEVIVKVERDKAAARLTLRWKGGALDEIDLALPRSRPATIRTDEDTIALVRRLAEFYPDTVIAGILNRQGRTTAYGHQFEASRVGNLRRHWNIPCFSRVPNKPKANC